MTITRQYPLNMVSGGDTGKEGFDKVDKELTNIISQANTDISTTNTSLTTHKSSGDHDSRYYTKTEVDSKFSDVDDDVEDMVPDLSLGRYMCPLVSMPLKNSTAMELGTGTVTFARSGPATYIDRYGVLQKVSNDVARFEEQGLLMEGTSTNTLQHSEDFSDSYWGKVRCTIGGTVNDPTGTSSTVLGLISNTDNNTHYIQTSGLSAGKTYTFSVFIKKGNKDWCRLQCVTLNSSYTVTGKYGSYFDISMGSVGSSDTYVFTNCTAAIQPCANGWYRCLITFTIGNGVDTTYSYIRIMSAESDNSQSFIGDGSTVNTYVYGAQLEEMPFPTSYIPTTTASVARAADLLKFTYNENIPDGEADVTILVDYDILGVISSGFQAVYGHTGTNLLFARVAHNGDAKINLRHGSELQKAWTKDTDDHRLGFVYTVSSRSLEAYLDGEQLSAVTMTNDLSNDTYFYLGARTGIPNDSLYGHISNFKVYDVALSEEEMRLA